MFERLLEYWQNSDSTELMRDGLDVALVYYVVYRALLVLRGTRAMQVGLGLAVVLVFYLVAHWLQLVTVLSILGALISSAILVIVVVFQNDIRRGLMRVGSRAWFAGLSKARETKVIDSVVEAATELARHRIGAIITFEQEANLDEFVGSHKGIKIDAAVTSELLVSLFIPEGINKLHDGAVIIQNLRIAKAGVFFPMPEGRVVDASFGSRHRAALGITEETDAVVVVVSEERGTISFCFNGNIASNLDGPKLRAMLEAIFSPKVRAKKPKKDKRISNTAVLREVEAEEVAREARESEEDVVSERSSAVETPPALKSAKRLDVAKRIDTPAEGRARESIPPPPLRPRVIPDPDAPSAQELVTTTPLPVSGKPLEPAAGFGDSEGLGDEDTDSERGDSA